MQRTLFDPMLSAAAGPARGIAWLESVLEWLTSEADSGARSNASSLSLLPVGFLERTSPASCPLTVDGIGPPSSETWQNWGMGSPTGFWTLSGSEFPKDAAVCSLSDVLETGDVPQKYFLSPKACRGILRRAETRGKELPPALQQALTQAATTDRMTTKTGD